MRLGFAFVGGALRLDENSAVAMDFDASNVVPAVGDLIVLKMLPSGERQAFRCVARAWDLSHPGKAYLTIDLDLAL